MADPRAPKLSGKTIEQIVPVDENKFFDMMAVIGEIIDEGSWCEIKQLFAKELLTGFAHIEGRVVGIVANQPKHLGGVLFVDSADKAARFIGLCDSFKRMSDRRYASRATSSHAFRRAMGFVWSHAPPRYVDAVSGRSLPSTVLSKMPRKRRRLSS